MAITSSEMSHQKSHFLCVARWALSPPVLSAVLSKMLEFSPKTAKTGFYSVYMDMMYMPDALDACVQIMEADPAKLVHRNSFNVTAMSFTPEMLYAELRKAMPEFTMTYDIDPVKESIARSWPDSLDDACAREEWGWKPKWDMRSMTEDMLRAVREKKEKGLI